MILLKKYCTIKKNLQGSLQRVRTAVEHRGPRKNKNGRMIILNITESRQGSVYTFVLDGELDTTTAPQLKERLQSVGGDITEIVFDFTSLSYISSAGLRTILLANEIIGDDGVITVRGANPMVADIFDTTGFSSMLNMI